MPDLVESNPEIFDTSLPMIDARSWFINHYCHMQENNDTSLVLKDPTLPEPLSPGRVHDIVLGPKRLQ